MCACLNVRVFDCVTHMLSTWGFRKFIPWCNNFDAALVAYCSLYTNDNQVTVVEARKWDCAVKDSPLKFYAWQGEEVPNPKVDYILIV